MNGQGLLRPGGASIGRGKQMQEASNMENFVRERAQRTATQAPPYRLLELIGKGSFGRVYKSQRLPDRAVVAVKIMDIDSSDYNLRPAEKDQALKDFITEISILRTLTDAKAKNINIFYDAFSFHSQLWIISEYCPGGSVHTLMKACPKAGLEEKYIIPIARELAIALTYIHKASIIHRDVKAANILITEEGQVQLCDFGVSGILEGTAAKRSTIIGTPYWMAPELHANGQQSYSTEVDCWAFGCTVYEMATGLPPNARTTPNMLHMALKEAPRLQGGQYSAALRDFVSFCLQERPDQRPDAQAIVDHPFLRDTTKYYPTNMLRQLIERFAQWEQSGGQRASLFNPYGAAGPSSLNSLAASGEGADDDWNFSTTDEFEQDMLSNYANSMEPLSNTTSRSTSDKGSVRTRNGSSTMKGPSIYDQHMEDQRVMRGGRKIERIFDVNAEPYEYSQGEEEEEFSDLPLRAHSNHSANRETIIDLDMATDYTIPDLSSVDLPTIKAHNRFYDDDEDDNDHEANDLTSKRLTREWKYPDASLTLPNNVQDRRKTQDWTMDSAVQEMESAREQPIDSLFAPTNGALVTGFRPTLKHTVTEPLGNFGDFLHSNNIHASVASRISLSLEPPDRASMIDIDPAYITRPSTAASSTGESAMTDFTTGDPFELEHAFDTVKIPQTSFHAHSQSEPARSDRDSNPSSMNNFHYRGDGSFSSDSEYDRNRQISVQASVDSLRQGAAADDYWDSEFVPDLRDRLDAHKNNKTPLMHEPEGLNYGENNLWYKYEPELVTTPTTILDTAPSYPPDPPDPPENTSKPSSFDSIKPPPSRYRSQSRGRIPPPLLDQRNLPPVPPPLVSPAAPGHPPPSIISSTSQTRGHSHHASVFSVTSTTSMAPSFGVGSSPEQSITAGTIFSDGYPPHYNMRNDHGGINGYMNFPLVMAPDPLALEDDADLEIVAGEMERLIADFLGGLGVAGELLGFDGGEGDEGEDAFDGVA